MSDFSPAGARPVAQQRSKETRDKLIAALERLIEKQSFTDITVQQLAAEAGVAVGTVYRRLEGKDALALLLLDLYQARLEAWALDPANALALTDTMDLRAALTAVARQIWRQLHAMPALMRATLVVSRARPDLVGDRLENMLQGTALGFNMILDRYQSEIKRQDQATTRRMVFYFFQTVMNDHGLFPGDLGAYGPPDDVEFAVEVADFAYGYLITPEAS